MSRQGELGRQSWRAANAALSAGFRSALIGALCALMVAPPAWAAEGVAAEGSGVGSKTSAIPSESHTAALTQQQKVLHALNRFTFGPRPGDEAAVRKMGLEKWFQMQLHPGRIDDSGFEAQMQAFPAMQLSETELLRRFPSPQMIRQETVRQTGARGDALPDDPVERAVYADAQASYEAQQKKQEEAAQGSVAAAAQVSEARPGAPGASGVAPSSPAHDDGTVMKRAARAAEETQIPFGNDNQKSKSNDNSTSNSRSLGNDNQKSNDNSTSNSTNNGSGSRNGNDGISGSAAAGASRKAEVKALKHQVPVKPMASEQVEAVLALAPEPRFQALVAMAPQESVSFRDALRPVERVRLTQGFTPAEMETVEAMQQPLRVVAAEATETRLLRDVESQRQLQAVMTDFWLNHFNVYVRKNQNEPYYLPAYERETILPNALGRFEDLLVATAKSPAMLMYLDNWQSIGPNSVAAERVEQQARQQVQKRAANGKPAQKAAAAGINENYGRELMELHTLGVGGGYTQKDVIEVAKCFTGWTIERPYGGGATAMKVVSPTHDGNAVMNGPPGSFVFMENRHEPGPKVVLGHTIPEGGVNEGLEVLHILATSPATAHFISRELAVRFVSDTPPPALVNRMAATFLRSDGDIKAVLTTMFHSPEFWSPKVYRAKVKTPVEFLASALRASDATVKNPLPLVQAMDRLGMPVYGMQTPNGYSWSAEDWVSSNALISRMNFALVLSGGRVPGTVTNWPSLLGSAADSDVVTSPTPATEKQLEGLLLGQPASARTRETVLAQFSEQFSDLAAQSVTEASFNRPPGAGMQPAQSSTPETGGFVRAGLSTKGGRGRQQQFNRPETPLDTMAGLLLGSPDFQRR